MENAKTKLILGVLVALDRDRAKQLFGAKQPADVRQCVNNQIEDETLWQQGAAIELHGHAAAFQETVSHADVADTELHPALEMTLLGGRPLADEDNLKVRVVRPDLVKHIATGLSAIDDQTFVNHWPDPSTDQRQIIDLLNEIRNLYQLAAASKSAVVFAWDPTGVE